MLRYKSRMTAILLAVSTLGGLSGAAVAAIEIEGQVRTGAAPIADATVTLWSATAGAPSQLAEVTSDGDGRFAISIDQSPAADASLYLVAKGGQPAGAQGDNPRSAS